MNRRLFLSSVAAAPMLYSASETILIRNAKILTVTKGRVDGSVLIRDGKIAEIGANVLAPTGATISSIEYANFGNSTGVCGAFTNGACVLYPDATVKSLVSAACVGKSTCSVAVDPSTFGTLTPPSDAACLTNAKLNVQYRTTGGSPAPAPSPSPSA